MKKNNMDAQINRLPFFKCFKKNVGYVYNLCPSYIPTAVLFTLIDRFMPFLSMILGAQIVDMLVNKADKEEIMTVVVIMVVSWMLLN